MFLRTRQKPAKMVEEYTFRSVTPDMKIRKLETEEDLRKLAEKLRKAHSNNRYIYDEQRTTVYMGTAGFPLASLGDWLVWYDGIPLDVFAYKVFNRTKTLEDIKSFIQPRDFWVQVNQ